MTARTQVLTCSHLKPPSSASGQLPRVTALVLSPDQKTLVLRGPHTLIALRLPRVGTSTSSSSSSASSSSALGGGSLGGSGSGGDGGSRSTTTTAPQHSPPAPSTLLGAFIHSPSLSPPLTAALFHPSSHDALIALDASGAIFEYDLSSLASGASSGNRSSGRSGPADDDDDDPSEPVQIVRLFSQRKEGRFDAVDPRSREAVALAFPAVATSSEAVDITTTDNANSNGGSGVGGVGSIGAVAGGIAGGGVGEDGARPLPTGDADWSRLTLYVGFANGDVRCLCPFVPTKRCVFPLFPDPFSLFHRFLRFRLLAFFLCLPSSFSSSLPPSPLPLLHPRTTHSRIPPFSARSSQEQEQVQRE